MSGLLPPQRPRFNPKKPSRANPLLQPATRADVFQVTKAMMKTWRALDVEMERLHARLAYLELPWYKRWFTTRPDQSAYDGSQPADLTGNDLDAGENPGDVSTATDGSEGPESEDEL